VTLFDYAIKALGAQDTAEKKEWYDCTYKEFKVAYNKLYQYQKNYGHTDLQVNTSKDLMKLIEDWCKSWFQYAQQAYSGYPGLVGYMGKLQAIRPI
jgi:hypothetical protein